MMKYKRMCVSIISFILLLSSFTGNITVEAKNYSYSVKPILYPINIYLFVQTDNPDPNSFRIVDKNSKYFDSSKTEEQGVYLLEDELFIDVVYEKYIEIVNSKSFKHFIDELVIVLFGCQCPCRHLVTDFK